MAEPITAYVLIKTAVGKTDFALKDILDIPKVLKATIVTGDYDIVAELESNSVDDILGTVAQEIRQIRDVTETKTLIGTKLPSYSPRVNL
ncbi:MAG: Lrp/AsnC family transcriptional regulator [Thermoplasmatales archaeon]|nr:Lrp/AsnC family transcriptional regulator [Thermoplasmatales archaeon]